MQKIPKAIPQIVAIMRPAARGAVPAAAIPDAATTAELIRMDARAIVVITAAV